MKHIFIFIIIFMVGITSVLAQNPIPSYNFPVYQRANFQENQGPTRAKKKVNVTAQCVSGKSLTCTATVWIYSLDMQGSLLKTYKDLNNSGEIAVNSYEFNPGMFLYTLIVDGVEIDTKRMILTK